MENQETTLLSSLKHLQDIVGDARRTFERAEDAGAKERRELVQAIDDEKRTALEGMTVNRRCGVEGRGDGGAAKHPHGAGARALLPVLSAVHSA